MAFHTDVNALKTGAPDPQRATRVVRFSAEADSNFLSGRQYVVSGLFMCVRDFSVCLFWALSVHSLVQPFVCSL